MATKLMDETEKMTRADKDIGYLVENIVKLPINCIKNYKIFT